MRSTIKMDAAYGVRSPELPGDWRRRKGTKTDAHLYRRPEGHLFSGTLGALLPLCFKRIPRGMTEAVAVGRPCGECLVMAITRRTLYSDAPESGAGR